MICHEINSAS